MSSGVESGGSIAAAVLLPVGVAFGAGWLAWQAGKLIVEANRSVDEEIREKKKQLEEAALLRKQSALAAHSQLVDMCTQILSQVEAAGAAAGAVSISALEQIKSDLRGICGKSIPEDTAQIERLNSFGFLKLSEIIDRQRALSEPRLETGTGLYQGTSLADLMHDINVAISAIRIQASGGENVQAADPDVLERVKLNEELSEVITQIMAALRHAGELASSYGMFASDVRWLQSCFNGIDRQIESLLMPSTPNSDLKKGIKRLKESLERYDELMPSIEKDRRKFDALYKIYCNASEALGETIESAQSFKSAKDLDNRLEALRQRAALARECAELYRHFGREAYICYAWDQELSALGYKVHTRTEIAEMANFRPERARLGSTKIPPYRWKGEELTQLYSIASECSLQIIAHEDGSVTMKALADTDGADAVPVQAQLCSRLKMLHENLRKNWFITYEYKETASADEVTSAAEWFGSDDSAWKSHQDEVIPGRRLAEEEELRHMHMK